MPAAHLDFLARHRHHDNGEANPGGTRKPHPAAPAGEAANTDSVDFWKISRLLGRLRIGAGLFLRIFLRACWQPRTRLAAAELFSSRLFALDAAGRGCRPCAARV